MDVMFTLQFSCFPLTKLIPLLKQKKQGWNKVWMVRPWQGPRTFCTHPYNIFYQDVVCLYITLIRHTSQFWNEQKSSTIQTFQVPLQHGSLDRISFEFLDTDGHFLWHLTTQYDRTLAESWWKRLLIQWDLSYKASSGAVLGAHIFLPWWFADQTPNNKLRNSIFIWALMYACAIQSY